MKKLLRKLHLIEGQRSRKKRGVEIEERNRVRANARRSYPDHMANLLEKNEVETAMSLAVGGAYEETGEALRKRLVRHGLQPNDYLIDVGCGSGRLAFALARSPWRDSIRYLGIDIVPAMLEFAARKCQQPHWRFELIAEPKIPKLMGRPRWSVFFPSSRISCRKNRFSTWRRRGAS